MSLLQMYPDLLTWLAVPYLKPSAGVSADTLDGWDCWGCIRLIGREQFGVVHDDFSGAIDTAMVSVDGADALPNEAVARLIRDHLGLYRGVPRKAGAVALFRVGRELLHVAQMLTPSIAIHAIGPTEESAGGTFTIDLDHGPWSRAHRFIGCFEPA